MFNQRKHVQTASQPKRRYRFMLPLSKPKLIIDHQSFRNISSDADRTFTSSTTKINFSLKTLHTQRTNQTFSINVKNEQSKKDLRIVRVNHAKHEKSKLLIILCIDDKEIKLQIFANTVDDLTLEIEKYLKINKLNSNFKTVQTVQDDLALNYLLSIPDINIHGILYRNIKIRPNYGCSQTQVNIHNFQIIRAIGSGGFSIVYLCRYKKDGKYYAMKAISKSFIAKNKKQKLVMNQRYVMKAIEHPFLAKLHWSFQSKKYLIFVMDYYPGGELFGVLKRYKRMNQEMARFYMTEVLLGLQGLHLQGIAYRDLKPQNILIDKDGHAYISDFGLVKPGLKDPETRTFSFCGSPQYMPPQVVARKGHRKNADFYSLGALLYELLTGLPPFYHQDPEEIYKGTLNGSLSLPSYLTESAKDLLKKLLCKSEIHRLGAQNGVNDVLNHPWFCQVDRERFLKKKNIPPISFTRIQDLSFNEGEMKKSNTQYLKVMHQQQKQSEHFSLMLPDFRYNRYDEKFEQKQNLEQNLVTNRFNNLFKKKKSLKTISSLQRFKIYDNFL